MADVYATDARYIDSLHWFDQHNGAKQFLVYTAYKSSDSGALIRVFNGSQAPASNPWDTLEHVDGGDWDGSDLYRHRPSGPWQGEQSVAWGGRLYLANGSDRVIVYDGDKTTWAGYENTPSAMSATAVWPTLGIDEKYRFGGLGAAGFGPNTFTTTTPSSAVITTADSVHYVGLYRYRYSHVNERGQESPLSRPSSPVRIAATTDYKRGFAALQVPEGPPGTVARRVYRTRNLITLTTDGASGYEIDSEDLQYYFLEEIQDNCTTDTEDGKPDSLLGSLVLPESLGPVPGGVDFMAVYKNTMFYSSSVDNQIYFSRPLMPEVVPPLNRFECGGSKSGPCRGMISFKNALVVFRARGIYLIKGDPASGFYSQTLTEDTGCIAPNTIADIPGLGVAFLSPDGLSLLDGALENTGSATQVVNLGTPIQQYFEKINSSAVIASVGVVYHDDKEYWLNIPTIGKQDNNLTLVFHYAVGEWSIREDFPIKCAVETGDHRGYLYFGSNDSSKHGIFVYSHGFGDKGGDAITPKWESVHHSVNSPYKTMVPVSVRALAVAYGNNDLQLDYRINRSIDDVRSSPVARDQQDPGDTLDVYGTAELGPSSRWGFFRPTVVSFDLSTRDKNRTREFQVAFSAEDTRIQLLGYDIEVQAGEQENITPIGNFSSEGGR